MLYDLTAIDERVRAPSRGPAGRATSRVVYHLLSFERNADIRVKVALDDARRCRCRRSPTSGRRRTGTSARSGTCSASRFDGHPHLRRILHAADLAGPSAAQGPSGARHRDGRRSSCPTTRRRPSRRRCAFDPRMGPERAVRRHRLHVPQPRPAASRHARRPAHRAAARRRGDRRRGARHRLSPPRRREDGRAPVVAHLHPVHRSHRLPRRRDEQPRLPARGREAGRHRGAGPRARSSA